MTVYLGVVLVVAAVKTAVADRSHAEGDQDRRSQVHSLGCLRRTWGGQPSLGIGSTALDAADTGSTARAGR